MCSSDLIVHERPVGRLEVRYDADLLARRQGAVPPRRRLIVDDNVASFEAAKRDGLARRDRNRPADLLAGTDDKLEQHGQMIMKEEPALPESLVDKRLRYIERQRALHKERVNVVFEGRAPEGTGPANRHGMPKLPTGQRQVPNWPILDLGDSPEVSLEDWRLEVGGHCENPLTLTWQQFLDLPQADDVSDFHCVTTWSRMDNRWRGVRFQTIAELAVPMPDATHVLCYGYDHMPGTRIPY